MILFYAFFIGYAFMQDGPNTDSDVILYTIEIKSLIQTNSLDTGSIFSYNPYWNTENSKIKLLTQNLENKIQNVPGFFWEFELIK